MLTLVDCNAFYVPCERVFNPQLKGKPVMVLSNNDGYVVTRSDEVKALGVKMGTPAFQLRDLIRQHGIQVFSSNYALYGDLSRRVMETLELFSPDIEIYSIDEAFFDLSGQSYETGAQEIRQTVRKPWPAMLLGQPPNSGGQNWSLA